MERNHRKFDFHVNYICLFKSVLSIQLENTEEVVEQAEEASEGCFTSLDISELAACPWNIRAAMCCFTELGRELRAASPVILTSLSIAPLFKSGFN